MKGEGDLQSEFLENLNTIGDLKRSYIGCGDPTKDNDFKGAEKFKCNHLSLADADQPLIEKLPISSSIMKSLSQNNMTVCTTPVLTNLDEIDCLKRALKPDAHDVFEKPKVSVVRVHDNVKPEFTKVGWREVEGLGGSTKDIYRKWSSSPQSFELLSFLYDESAWEVSKLVQQDRSNWSSLDNDFGSSDRSESNKPTPLESGDSSFNSSSSEDASVDFGQDRHNHSSQLCFLQKQASEEHISRKLEKLPKEAKEEVEKFLKGFSQAPLHWTSDTEESSDGEDSLNYEGKVSTTAVGMRECKIIAEESMEQGGVRVDLNGNEMKNRKNQRSHSRLNTILASDEWLSLRENHLHAGDKELNANDEDNAIQSESIFYLGNSQALSLNNSQSCSLEHMKVNIHERIIDLKENAHISEQGFLPMNSGEPTRKITVKEKLQSVSTCTNSTLDQDQETISYVPTMHGLVLEQCTTSSSFGKEDFKIEEPLEEMLEPINLSSTAKIPKASLFCSQENSLSNQLPLNELGIQLASDNKLEVEPGLIAPSNTLKFVDPNVDDIRNADLGSVSHSVINPFSQSGVIPFSGSISLRSDSSNNSTRSFAFPILASEWNSSPVKMAPADPRYLRQKKQWSFCCFCCK